jgi:hypothetical protein
MAPGATAVVGRAAAGDFDEARIELPRLGIAEPLDLDCVLPTVTEVISQRYTSFFVPMSSRMSPSRAFRASRKSLQSVSGSGVLQPTPIWESSDASRTPEIENGGLHWRQ